MCAGQTAIPQERFGGFRAPKDIHVKVRGALNVNS